MRELAADGVTVLTLPLPFDQGPARSTACDTSSQGRSLTQRSGTSLTTLGRRTGPLSKAGERARSNWAAPRSSFHPEDLMRGSRSAPLPSSPPGAPARGRRGPVSRSGETDAAPPVASTAGAQGGATTVLVLEAASVSPWTPEASTAQEWSASPTAGCIRRQAIRAVASVLVEVQGSADALPVWFRSMHWRSGGTTQSACG